MDDEVGLDGPHSRFDRQPEIHRPRHPVPSRKHLSTPCCGSELHHAVSERRPLLRRPETIARPARVRMRSRKPCTRARRRLFG
jgi:hypothetical protein